MAATWLSIWSPPAGFSGSYVTEDTRIRPKFLSVLYVGDSQKSAYLRSTGRRSAKCPHTIAIMHDRSQDVGDYTLSKSNTRKFQAQPQAVRNHLHHFIQNAADCVLPRLVRPVCGAIVLFAEDVDGLDNAARMIASWTVQAKEDEAGGKPHLYVVSNAASGPNTCSISLLVRIELITALRAISPQRPYSMNEASQMVAACFRGITQVREEEIHKSLDDFEAFQAHTDNTDLVELIGVHLRDFGPQPFKFVDALNRRYPLPSCAYPNAAILARHLSSAGYDSVHVLASLLAKEMSETSLMGKFHSIVVDLPHTNPHHSLRAFWRV
ncbi:uncharacterized protein B0I36DRAFT_407652 [Microdochium trichocladiopsis]|uniref:Uncharacterized protein n=1 Tax=Microdochium trichocladiopsis TaxID=1682393 RepID=A0A9P9BRQ4_9PEZI|nr:uncharacterized protein B0I36DRAFT_407652 [Microdochium trichocladiopsis]KAH7033055.1 hypothetical protein B0I36DRAFT_407652 [Microdochium trichocladiopsis]